jgi:hypothetical protein
MLMVGVKPIEPKQRIITEEQRALFLGLVEQFPKGKIRIKGFVTDSESMGFANQLSLLLKDAGWSIDDTKADAATFGPVGLTLFSKIDLQTVSRESPLAHFVFLRNALERIGLDSFRRLNPNLAENETVIFVGLNLDPRVRLVE